MEARKIAGKLLMAFLLISIGVAIGKEVASHRTPPANDAAQDVAKYTEEHKVIVYYMHGVPCIECMLIEATTEEIVREDFSDAVEAGNLEFVSVNYLDRENATLANRYRVGSNMVIAVRFENGEEVARVRMDEVMERAGNQEKLADYLRKGIASAIEEEAE